MRWRGGDGGGTDGDGDVMSALLYCSECNVIYGENTTLPFVDINQWIQYCYNFIAEGRYPEKYFYFILHYFYFTKWVSLYM